MNRRIQLSSSFSDSEPYAGPGQNIESLVAPLSGRDETGVADVVKRVIANSVASGDPDLCSVARKLGMSARTLQRRLSEEGASHRQLVNQARRELAMQHLRENHISVSEVAFRLGYTNVKGFYRAFNRWTGQTPSEYRRSLISV